MSVHVRACIELHAYKRQIRGRHTKRHAVLPACTVREHILVSERTHSIVSTLLCFGRYVPPLIYMHVIFQVCDLSSVCAYFDEIISIYI